MPEAQARQHHRAAWRPPQGVLGELVQTARERAAEMASDEPAWRSRAERAPTTAGFADALSRDTLAIIAEVKRRSPSKGVISARMSAPEQARAYRDGGTSAISVLTEPSRFGGSASDLVDVVAAVKLPVIRKDFIVAPVQLYEARALGAAAALLIVRALDPALLRALVDAAAAVQLELLIEVHDEADLERALEVSARIVGVNNRDLETLAIDSGTCVRIVPSIPRPVVAVAESGMSTRADVEAASATGANAVLIGSSLSAAPDPRAAVAALAGVMVDTSVRPD